MEGDPAAGSADVEEEAAAGGSAGVEGEAAGGSAGVEGEAAAGSDEEAVEYCKDANDVLRFLGPQELDRMVKEVSHEVMENGEGGVSCHGWSHGCGVTHAWCHAG